MRIVAPFGFRSQTELRTEVTLDCVTGNGPQANLGAAQILKHRKLTSHFIADLADGLKRRGVLVVRAVGEVEPENVNAGLDHLADDGRIPRGGPEGCHNLGPHFPERLKNGSRHGSHREKPVSREPEVPPLGHGLVGRIRLLGCVSYRLSGMPTRRSREKTRSVKRISIFESIRSRRQREPLSPLQPAALSELSGPRRHAVAGLPPALRLPA